MPQLDLWFSLQLAKFLGQHQVFDLIVQSAIRHNVLGGFWYGMALFVFWVKGTRQNQPTVRQRILTTFLGSLIAVLFSLLAEHVIAHLPPSRHPAIERLYPDYLELNPSSNSFPSQSTTLYTAVTAGIYSLNKLAGAFLWVALVLLVALPRMYVGGHYLSDVIAGLTLGLAGYAISRHLLERSAIPRLEQVWERHSGLRVVGDVVVYTWILQVAIEFRDAVWLKQGLGTLLRLLLKP